MPRSEIDWQGKSSILGRRSDSAGEVKNLQVMMSSRRNFSTSKAFLTTATSIITLGLRSSKGRERIQVNPSTSAVKLKTQIRELLSLDVDFVVRRDKNGRPGEEIALRGLTVSGIGLKHGDVLYVTPLDDSRFRNNNDSENLEDAKAGEISNSTGGMIPSVGSTSSFTDVVGSSRPSTVTANVQEDSVDIELSKQDGMIPQQRTSNCQHKSGAACIHCAPRDPFDPEHMKKEGIKFLSFHAYLRKLGREKGKFAALDDINLKIKPGCGNHAPWPESICSACQPPAMTLNRQTYRHVDNIMFENPQIVDNFLGFWRATGSQRIGYLYGRYETFPDVPLGIKAVVCAIYEPPQEGGRDYVKLQPDENEVIVEWIAASLGLLRVGWIFTDLVADSKGQVKHYRNVDSYFLSAQECATAAHYQNSYPNVTRRSPSGKHGSKFVTVCVTGSADRQVHMEGYQVSNQCMALVRDNIFVPTKDAPELGYVRESSARQYVPDAFFKEKDEYGNEVTKVARPLPIEYLLIDVPVSTPKEPLFTFASGSSPASFPVENRPMEGHLQDFSALAKYRQAFDDLQPSTSTKLGDFFLNIHLLIYLATQTVHPLDKSTLQPLLYAIREQRLESVLQWIESSHWCTIEALIHNYNDGYQ